MGSAHDGLKDGSEYIYNTISIAIAGDYRSSDYEKELDDLIIQLVTDLKKYYPNIHQVVGHKDIDATQCPGLGWDDELKNKLNQIVSNVKVASISRYAQTYRDDPWFFRNDKGEYKGRFYPSNEGEREKAYQKDFQVNCQGSCDHGSAGVKLVQGWHAACDPKYPFGTKFIIKDKTFTCFDRGGAIRDHKRGGNIALDLLVPKGEWKAYEKYSGVQDVQVILPQ